MSGSKGTRFVRNNGGYRCPWFWSVSSFLSLAGPAGGNEGAGGDRDASHQLRCALPPSPVSGALGVIGLAAGHTEHSNSGE